MREFKKELIASLFVPAVGLSVGIASAADGSKTPSSAQSRPVTQASRDMRASKLIGSEVRNARDESLGEIKDLIVDVNNDRVYYAVLSFGGFLGFGDELLAYPVRMFTQAADGDKLLLELDGAKLEGARGMDEEKERAADWSDDVDRYFGRPVEVRLMPNQLLRRASELIGKEVDGRDGKNLGNIRDLVVNMGKGSVRYAVFEFHRPRSVNDTAVMVPLRIFNFSPDRGHAVMNVDKSNLDDAVAK